MNVKTIILSLLITSTIIAGYGQDHQRYATLISEASKLYESKEYLRSAKTFSEAFASLGNKGYTTDRYNAACAWALAEQPDSAFSQLFRIATLGNYTNLSHISSDQDFSSLYKDNRWAQVLAMVKANKDKAEANLDPTLVALLDGIYEEDQQYRRQTESIAKQHGRESAEMRAHWGVIHKKDSMNLIAVRKILDQRGWLGADVVGSRGNSTLFLVIQHADLKTQQHYLPMMREAVKKGNAQAPSLALLEDRVALGEGRKQLYGSQIGRHPQTGENYVLPLEDPDKVDQRRATMGLEPLANYVARFNFTWDVASYKMKLPEYEKLQR